MGRVARYKKIKSFDPYSKENGGRVQLDQVGVWGLGDNGRKTKKRSKTAEKLRAKKRKRQVDDENPFDLPPEGEDDFDLADLVGSVKKEKNVVEENDSVPNPIKTVIPSAKLEKAAKEDEHLQNSKLLKIDKQLEKKLNEAPEVKRLPGESKKAFDRRIKAETRMIIKEQRINNRNPEKKQRKKEFLNNKKKKKSEAMAKSPAIKNISDDDSDVDIDDDFVTGEQAAAYRAEENVVPFNAQAERPPSFKHLPRGAIERKRPNGQTKLSEEADIEAEKMAMELIRRKVQAQYTAIKLQRRQRGDFHL